MSRRCISCGSDLIIDGYVRCSNCRALTPLELEFCELCGSYISMANQFGHGDSTALEEWTNHREAAPPPLHQATSPEDEASSTLEERLGIDRRRTEARKKDIPADTDVPGWLLDVDAALKSGTTSDLPEPTVERREDWIREQGVALNGGTPEEESFESPAPEVETIEETESLDWIDALKGDLEPAEPKPAGEAETPRISKPTAAAAAAGAGAAAAGAKKRKSGTQPLESKDNLMGVPRQLAGTELPSWLSDQLQRPERSEEEVPEVEIELPEPVRSTIVVPVAPEPQEKPPAPSPVLDESFEKWLKDFSEESISPDWMVEADEQYEEAIAADILAKSAKTPGTMQEVQEGEVDSAELLGIEEVTELRGTLSGLKGTIQIAAAMSGVQTRRPRVEYSLSKQHQKQIALLEGIINAETVKRRPKTVVKVNRFPASLRVLLAVALLAIVIVPLLVPSSVDWISDLATLTISQPVQQFHDQIEQAAGQPVLVAFDYSPAMSGEMNAVAEALLGQLAANGSSVIITSQSASGFQLGQSIASETEDLSAFYLGYLPGEAVSLRSLARCMDESMDCQTIFGESIPPEIQELLGETNTVAVLASESGELQAWIEQVGAVLPDEVLLAAVTQTLGPLTAPYYTAGQLEGVLVGSPDLAAYEQEFLDVEGNSARNFTISTAAIWLIAAFLLIGVVYYAITGLRSGHSQ